MMDPGNDEHHPAKPARPKRPFPLKLIIIMFALWTLLGWLRFGRALVEGDLIMDLLSPGLYGYLLLAGLSWGLLGLPTLWGILRRTGWAPLLLKVAAVLFPALYWFERLLLWQDPSSHSNWPLMLLLTAAWFGLVVWGLHSARARAYFSTNKNQNEVSYG
jgi:hypothetical protein